MGEWPECLSVKNIFISFLLSVIHNFCPILVILLSYSSLFCCVTVEKFLSPPDRPHLNYK